MSNCCIISIGWLTSSVDSSVHLVMSLVSHYLLYTHHVHLILLLRLCVGHTFIPFISDSLVSVDFVPFVVVFDV